MIAYKITSNKDFAAQLFLSDTFDRFLLSEGQPAWEEMQTESPCSYFISTVSITLPSGRRKAYFSVPSIWETRCRTTSAGSK